MRDSFEGTPTIAAPAGPHNTAMSEPGALCYHAARRQWGRPRPEAEVPVKLKLIFCSV